MHECCVCGEKILYGGKYYDGGYGRRVHDFCGEQARSDHEKIDDLKDKGHTRHFDIESKTIESISNPETYKGIYAFHKYWGKKPSESLSYFIQNCTNKGDIVLDPFLGSGLISIETHALSRRFIGIDINPFSIEHTSFLLSLPNPNEYMKAIHEIKNNVHDKIFETYRMSDGKYASHYLWEKEKLIKVWRKPETGKTRIEFEPTNSDIELIQSFEKYEIRNIKKGTFFENARINAKADMSIYNLFTRRALYNIDLLLDEIKKYPEKLQRALLLTLTSSSGQMSSMVFAISGRGKTKNEESTKIEVGSWVIGLWCPELHFEINVWNCFENRAKKLHKALLESTNRDIPFTNDPLSVVGKMSSIGIVHGNSLNVLSTLPEKSIKLIITDPPHSDRIPYLELSEMWNCLLNKDSDFSDEIVVSNAKERNKNKMKYLEDMSKILIESNRILLEDGFLLMYFNARDKQSWDFFTVIKAKTNLEFVGAFPMEYSANSVVQDNRKGAMKTDYLLVFKHHNGTNDLNSLNKIPGWIIELPKQTTASGDNDE